MTGNPKRHSPNATINYLLRNVSGRLGKVEKRLEKLEEDKREEVRAMVEGMINSTLAKVDEKRFNFWVFVRDKVSPAIIIIIVLEILKLIPK